ncbi:hypothetical protein BDV96DRAFT_505972 [Lophiotrema nucula]|uniref:DRBM domain-containing protein n=1 Tax=Lophiotrema nucula TaxID=690887 RepID=A0A6A5YK33_9PLEO|nr:hypothetical protein BDV96DRAFT_505972 [Lophiotrema nucula]
MYAKSYEEEKLAAAAKKQPPSKKIKSTNNEPLAPVALSARSSKNTVELHEKLQFYGITQTLEFGGSTLEGWTAKTEILGEVVEEKRLFSSKQEAKEVLSGRALELVKRLEAEGKLSKPGKSKRSKSAASTVDAQEQEKPEPGPNYIGQLLEFQRSTNSTQPTYQDYGLGTKFACVVTIEGVPETFGSINDLFTSKKLARQNAAKCAVEHFKSTGAWPESFTDVGGIKKKKKVQPSEPGAISLDGIPIGPSPAQKVAPLAAELGLGTPQWEYETATHPQATGMTTVACHFRNGGPHAGPIGEVRNVFGRKRAKDECARLVVEYLEQLKDQRLSYGRKMLERIDNADEVVSAGAEQPDNTKMVRGSESEDEFHDAE